MTTYFGDHLLTGDHASRPGASAVPEGTLYACSDHDIIYQSDGTSAWSTWATMAPPAGGNPVLYDIERYTGGNIAITSSTDGAAMSGIGNLVVAAAAGDLLHIGIDASLAVDTESVRVDVASIVSASPVNYVSSLTGTPLAVGIPGWGWSATTLNRLGHVIPYVAQAGDISGGNITLSLRGWLSSGTSRSFEASATVPLVFWTQNFGQ
jgi:hypothetical protein